MTLQEAFRELTQPEQRKRHLVVFTKQLKAMVLDVVVFLLTLYILSLLLHIRWTVVGLFIGVVGGVLLWAWMLTGGKVDER